METSFKKWVGFFKLSLPLKKITKGWKNIQKTYPLGLNYLIVSFSLCLMENQYIIVH